MSMQELLIRVIAVVGLAWYFICVFHLGLRPTPKDKQANGFRQFQALSVTTISVSLATFVGFVIGLKGKEHIPSSTPAGATTTNIARAASQPDTGVISKIVETASYADLQWWSAGLYVVSLILALWFYYRTQDNTEPAITGLAKSLLGFVAGVLSIALTVPGAA
jgi:hypothetical protein